MECACLGVARIPSFLIPRYILLTLTNYRGLIVDSSLVISALRREPSRSCLVREDILPLPSQQHSSRLKTCSKFTVTDLNGEKRIRSGTQLSQSGRLSLQTPYIVFGLGRTSDYIQDFAFAVPLQGPGKHYNYWICIIPNSQLVAIPYHALQPETCALLPFPLDTGRALCSCIFAPI